MIVKPGTIAEAESVFPAECREDLRRDMTEQAEECFQGIPMLKDLLANAVIWMDAFASHGKTSSNPSAPRKELESKPQEPGKVVVAPRDVVDGGTPRAQKLPRLRTSEDVIARIMWDDRLKRSRFTVGYLDRFSGVMEDKFNAFCWDQPLAAVDNDTLAIPQHRIQYFKYGEVKVWDKSERLDRIFGSTGGDVEFYDLIEEIDKAEGKEAVG